MVDIKNVLDILYIAKHEIAEKSRQDDLMGHQLPDDQVARKNLAFGRADAHGRDSMIIDKVIREVIELKQNA